MGVLVLVRHAQASFFSEDYDRLSPLGEVQARHLGGYWARTAQSFDEVYAGPRQRQRQTASLIGQEYRAAGHAWPETVVLDVLDEYDLSGLLERLAPELARRDRAFDDLAGAYRRSTDDVARVRTFQRMFEHLLDQWIETPGETGTVESWPVFRDRVGRAIRRLTDAPGHGRRVVAVTSGGVIGTAVALALGAADRTAMELSWRLRNGSASRFLFRPGRLTLDEFNTVPHLDDPTLWTYR